MSPKGHCISRLELMAYVFLARLITEVKKSIEKKLVVGDEMYFVGRVLWSRCGGPNKIVKHERSG